MTDKTIYPLPSIDSLRSKERFIPSDVFSSHGCLRCSWRSSSECPHYCAKSSRTTFPASGICNRRKAWLLAITPDYTRRVTLSQWTRDFMLALGTIRLEGELRMLQLMEDELKQLPIHSSDSEVNRKINTLDQRLSLRKNHVEKLWSKILHYTDAQVDRETPKKVEVKRMTIKPSDVADMIKNNVIEVNDVED